METNKHEKGGGSAFLWGLIIGALLATLLTNKRGRLILKEILNLGISPDKLSSIDILFIENILKNIFKFIMGIIYLIMMSHSQFEIKYYLFPCIHLFLTL